MRRGRSTTDQEGLRRVLLLGGVLLGSTGVGLFVAGLVTGGWQLFAGPLLVAFAAACVVVSRDDGRGQWCSECVARNPEEATTCEAAGPRLSESPDELRIERVDYGHPDAMLLIAEVQAEYVARYGGPDATPLDPLMFEPPLGSFFVGYLHLEGAERAGGDRRLAGPRRRRGVRDPAYRRDQADVRRPRGPRARAGAADPGPPRGRPPRRPAPRR